MSDSETYQRRLYFRAYGRAKVRAAAFIRQHYPELWEEILDNARTLDNRTNNSYQSAVRESAIHFRIMHPTLWRNILREERNNV